MKNTSLLFFIVALELLTACSPRVSIKRTESATTPSTPTAFVLTLFPADSISKIFPPIGYIDIKQGLFSGTCDPLFVLSKARQGTRQVGGNLLRIEQQTTNRRGCPELAAAIYRLDDLSTVMDLVLWSEHRRLKTTDFLGEADELREANALSHTGMVIEVEIDGPKAPPRFIVYAYFNKKTSWILEEDKQNVSLLAHEQLHFDIAEYHKRILQHNLASLDLTKENCLKEAEVMFQKQLEALKIMQHNYDQETWHGLNRATQAEWAARLEHLLATSSPKNGKEF